MERSWIKVDSPKVSVIIPCYNGERFIARAIESVLEQSFLEFEIVVVDDASSDGSIKVVQNFRSEPRLLHIVHEKNKGIAAARNTGIKNSSGEYIAFLDQDDYWEPDKLARQVDILDQDQLGDIGLVFSDVRFVAETSGKKRQWLFRAPEGINTASKLDVLKQLFLRNFVQMVSVMVRRKCFDEVGMLDERIRSGSDDYEFCFRVLKRYRFAHITEPLAVRRIHGGNYADIEKLFPDLLKILGRELEFTPELGEFKNRRLSDLHKRLAVSYLLKGDTKKARRAYRRSIQYDRSNTKAYLGMLLSCGGVVGWKISKELILRGMP